MTMTQITKQATKMNLSPQILEMLAAAFEAGKTEGVQDAAITLADNDEGGAAEFLATNYGFEIA